KIARISSDYSSYLMSASTREPILIGILKEYIQSKELKKIEKFFSALPNQMLNPLLNKPDSIGNTLMSYAIRRGDDPVINYLKSHGIKITEFDINRIIVDLARKNDFFPIQKLM